MPPLFPRSTPRTSRPTNRPLSNDSTRQATPPVTGSFDRDCLLRAAAFSKVHQAPIAHLPTQPQWIAGPMLAESVWATVRLVWGPGQSQHEEPCYVMKRAELSHEPRRARQALEQEARVLEQVRHRHLISLLDANLSEAAPYLILPRLVAPRSHTHRTSRLMPLQLGRVLDVALQLLGALRALHAAGWIHGDLQPDHVAVDGSLHTTLFDLGLARRISNFSPISETPPSRSPRRIEDRWQGAVTGSLATLAPEGFRPHAPIEPSRDFYALGLVLYQWLVGHSPWTANDAQAWERIQRTQAADLNPLRHAKLPIELVDLIGRLLAKDPLRRPEAIEIEERLLQLTISQFGHWVSEAA